MPEAAGRSEKLIFMMLAHGHQLEPRAAGSVIRFSPLLPCSQSLGCATVATLHRRLGVSDTIR